MYIALTSFAINKNVYAEEDIRKGQILPSDFVSADVIQDLLNANYIKEFDGLLEITENGQYELEGFEVADVNVEGSSEEVNALVDEINGEVI